MSGGNLAAVMCIVAIERRWKYRFAHQLLVYPWCKSNLNYSAVDLMSFLVPRSTMTESQKRHDNHSYMVSNTHDRWFLESYLPNRNHLESYYVNPLLAPDHILSHLPPAHIISAGHDPIQDDAIEFCKVLRRNGVKVIQTHFANTAHGFFTLDFLPEAKDAHVRVAEVLRQQFNTLYS
jgi:acetyl esterase